MFQVRLFGLHKEYQPNEKTDFSATDYSEAYAALLIEPIKEHLSDIEYKYLEKVLFDTVFDALYVSEIYDIPNIRLESSLRFNLYMLLSVSQSIHFESVANIWNKHNFN